MLEFWVFFEKGLRHVLNLFACDHTLFLFTLTIPYSFKNWKRLLLLTFVFSICHTLALMVSIFGMIVIKGHLADFLVPMTILIMAFFNLYASGKSSRYDSINGAVFTTLLFGVIHGMGFAYYFEPILVGSPQSKIVPISEFSLGMEVSQIITIFIILIISYIVQTLFRFSKRDWIIAMSCLVIGVVLPMIIASDIWFV